MEHHRHDDTKLIAIIGLLVSVLLIVSILFGVTYFFDFKHTNQEIDVRSCYSKGV